MADPSRAILNPSGPPPMSTFQPVLPYGLGGLAGGVTRAPTPIEAPARMDTSYSTLVTETLVAALPDEAVDNYEFAPLFVELGKNDEIKVWSQWDLNSKLRSVAADRRRKVRGQAGESFPCTIAEFSKRFKFAGFQIGAIQNPAYGQRRFKTDRRVFTVQLKGELHNFPNVWGAAARCGYDVGFQVCYVNLGGREATQPRDWKGERLDGPPEAPELRALQIVPIVCAGGTVPLETLPLKDAKYVTHSRELVSLRFDGVDEPVAVDMNHTACYIYVGRCVRLMGKASQHDTDNASHSAAAYRNLAVMRSQIDLEMMPEGKSMKWVV